MPALTAVLHDQVESLGYFIGDQAQGEHCLWENQQRKFRWLALCLSEETTCGYAEYLHLKPRKFLERFFSRCVFSVRSNGGGKGRERRKGEGK